MTVTVRRRQKPEPDPKAPVIVLDSLSQVSHEAANALRPTLPSREEVSPGPGPESTTGAGAGQVEENRDWPVVYGQSENDQLLDPVYQPSFDHPTAWNCFILLVAGAILVTAIYYAVEGMMR